MGACDPGFADCDANPANGCEVDATTTANCGGCGKVCSTNNAMAACNGGACQLTCNNGFGNCDANAANGCESNVTNDAMNCGACGHACSLAHATASCAAGACGIASCDARRGHRPFARWSSKRRPSPASAATPAPAAVSAPGTGLAPLKPPLGVKPSPGAA